MKKIIILFAAVVTNVYFGYAQKKDSDFSIQSVCNPSPATPTYQLYVSVFQGDDDFATLIAAPNGSCGPATFSIAGTPGSGGNTIRWYSTSTSTPHLTQNITFTTPYLTASRTYYMSTYSTTSGCESSRILVNVPVNAVPGQPSVSGSQSICGQGIVELTATAGTNGTTVRWFDNNSSTYPVTATGLTYRTASLTTSATYYARTYNANTWCHSNPVQVTVTVNPKPSMPLASVAAVINGQGSTTVTATAGDGGNQVKWYMPGAASSFLQGTSYTTPLLVQNQTYYLTTLNSTTLCESDKSAVPVTVLPIIASSSVQEDFIRRTGITSETQIATLPLNEKTTVFSYYDALARTIQTVAKQVSPTGTKDLVSAVDYNALGQVSKSYLPYVALTANGEFKSDYASAQATFYTASNDKIANDPSPFSTALYEASPSARIKEVGRVGQAWQPGSGHTARFSYAFNTGATTGSKEEVRLFNTDGSSSGFYAANKLYRTESTDANGNLTITFTDMHGSVVAKKQQLDETIDGVQVTYLETYYVYNEFGKLRYIITPKGTKLLKSNGWDFSLIKDQHAYQFVYDALGRVVEKKDPGKALDYVVYDSLNRVVLLQDGLLRKQKKWTFIKYDLRGRTVMTGFYLNTTQTDRVAMQTLVNGLYTASNTTYPKTDWYEKRTTLPHGYTNNSFPEKNTDNTALEVLTVNFYDGYDFDDTGTVDDFAYVNQSLPGESPKFPTSLLGLATGSKRLKLGTTSTYLYTYIFYNKRGQVIQVRGDNHLRVGMKDNLITNVYDDEGKLKASKNYHYASGSAVTIRNEYIYDNQGRLLEIKQNNLGSTPDQVLAKYEYNELGQLVDKKLHKKTDGTYLQSVDYRYTIRGQLASINNAQLTSDNGTSNDETNDYFGLEMLYNQVEAGVNTVATAKYDGNISAVKWKSIGGGSGPQDQKSYDYAYDKIGQMKGSTFQMHDSLSWSREGNTLNEQFKYDHNGNIAKLSRRQNLRGIALVNNKPVVTSTPQVIDSLDYTYTTDKLTKVEDIVNKAAGFTNGAATNDEYVYDENGNVVKDKNKGIDSIIYNVIGKPAIINFADGRKIEYFYDASGAKLTMKTYAAGSATPQVIDYVNGFVYENAALRFFGSPEGRVVKNGSSYEYQYALSDQQGNTRIVFSSVTPAEQTPSENFETTSNAGGFDNPPGGGERNTMPIFNHTPGGTHSYLLNGGYNSQVGLGKDYEVFPGDYVKIEAWGKYESGSTPVSTMGFATALLSAFSLSAPAPGETGTASWGLNNWGGFVDGGSESSSGVAAYVTIVVYDKNYNILKILSDQISSTATSQHDYMMKDYTIKEHGFVYMYISNHSSTPRNVYFDDVKMTYAPTNVIQGNEYYPFGLETSNSWTRTNASNNFKYNAGSEQNNTTGWYETYFRDYDPALGRFMQFDPLSVSEQATYQYAGNNPVSFNDPLGARKNMRDIDRWALAEEVENSVRAYRQMFSDWGMDSGPAIPGSGGGHWSDQLSVLRSSPIKQAISAAEFISSALLTKYGGSWSNGEGYAFQTEQESFDAAAAYFQQHTYEPLVSSNIHDKVEVRWRTRNGRKEKISMRANKGWRPNFAAIAQQDPIFGHDFVDPNSFNFQEAFGRLKTEAYYSEVYFKFKPFSGRMDIFELDINSIAIDVAANGMSREVAQFVMADSFNDARQAVYDVLDKRSISAMDAREIFLKALTKAINSNFVQGMKMPNSISEETQFMFEGDVPISVIQFINPRIKFD